MSSQTGQKFSTLDPNITLGSKDIVPLTQTTPGGTKISTRTQLGTLRDFFSMELRFKSVNEGIANTLDTQYFLVINKTSNTLDLYRNDNGVAVFIQDEIASNAAAAEAAAKAAKEAAEKAESILTETKSVVSEIDQKVTDAKDAATSAKNSAEQSAKSLEDIRVIEKNISEKVIEIQKIGEQVTKDAQAAQEAAASVLNVKETLEAVLGFYKVIDLGVINDKSLVIDPNQACMQSLTLIKPNTNIDLKELTGPTGIYRQLTVLLKQGTGANKVDWGTSIRWSNGRKPTLSYRKDAVDLITLLTVDGGLTWLGMFNGGWFNVQ